MSNNNMVYIRTDKNGTKIYHDYTCPRCGGAGGADQWIYTGWTCYECGGTGSQSITVKKGWIDKAKEQSLAMRKEDYAIAVSFGDPKEYYLIEDNLMEDLYKSREALRAVIDALGGLEDRLVDLDNLTGNGIRALIRRHLE